MGHRKRRRGAPGALGASERAKSMHGWPRSSVPVVAMAATPGDEPLGLGIGSQPGLAVTVDDPVAQ